MVTTTRHGDLSITGTTIPCIEYLQTAGTTTSATTNYNHPVTNREYIWTDSDLKAASSSGRRQHEVDIDIRLRLLQGPSSESIGTILTTKMRNWGKENTLSSRQLYSKELAIQKGLDNFLKEEVFPTIQHAAKETGRAIAKKVLRANESCTPDGVYADGSIRWEDIEMKIPINGGKESFKVRLGDLVTENLSEGERLNLDFKKIQLSVRNRKKYLYREKLNTIMIVKKENKALDLLNSLITPDQFKNYKKCDYVDVKDLKDKWKIYRIYKIGHIRVIDSRKQKIDHELCIHLDNPGGPVTDSVVAKLLMARFDVQALYKGSNKYDKNISSQVDIMIVDIDGR